MARKSKKIVSIYPEETCPRKITGDTKYQIMIVTKEDENIKIDDVNTISVSDVEKVLKKSKPNSIVGVAPSQNYFQRIISLPPVSEKRLPELMKFEAVQNIPFDINDVYWNWRILDDFGVQGIPGKIVAIKKESVDKSFPFKKMKYLTALPEALPSIYQNKGEERLELILGIGKDITDFVVCKGGENYWSRCIPIGSETDRVEEGKSDLVTEVERIIGFWKQSHPDDKIERLLLPNTNIESDKLDQIYEKIEVAAVFGHAYNKFENSLSSGADQSYFPVAAGILGSENAINLIGKNKYKTPREPIRHKIGRVLEGIGNYLQE